MLISHLRSCSEQSFRCKNVCKFFIRGECKFDGSKCVYAHDTTYLPAKRGANARIQTEASQKSEPQKKAKNPKKSKKGPQTAFPPIGLPPSEMRGFIPMNAYQADVVDRYYMNQGGFMKEDGDDLYSMGYIPWVRLVYLY